MGKFDITNKSRDILIDAIAKELDTRDKRFMFLKISFPKVLPMIELEGSSFNVAWNIYSEFEKQRLVGSLICCMNSYFDSNLNLELKIDK
jgi:hypothetical protein